MGVSHPVYLGRSPESTKLREQGSGGRQRREGPKRMGESTLHHYSKALVARFANSLNPPANEHKPGGLWVSEESANGWRAFLLAQLRRGSDEWSDGEELLRYRYDFAVKSGDRDCIRELRTPRDLRIFTGEYQEPAPRECVVDGKVGHGIHIEWHRVQRDHKGILIMPFQEALSHLKPDGLHWYRFDCTSGCFWDVGCLEILAWPQDQPIPPVIDAREQNGPN